MGGLLRDLTFPKQMRWDAYLEDGKGALVFARPIRWLVLMYGGRVVPFVIRRTEQAQGPNVQDIRSGSQTYGHRFLTTSGRAGRAIKIKTFEDYQDRLVENFVILDRAERESRIRRELETHARRLGGRVSGLVAAHSSLLQEVPDLVEYPVGRRRTLPGRVPPAAGGSADDDDDSSPALLPGGGRGRQAEAGIPGGHEYAAREAGNHRAQRRTRADGAAARRAVLLGRGPQDVARVAYPAALDHPVPQEAGHLPREGGSRRRAGRSGSPGRRSNGRRRRRMRNRPDAWQRPTSATDMVRELTELQGTMGGIYAREEGLPEQVWKAIYFHYLPVGVEADAPPSRQQLGGAAVTWAAVSLADKLDSVVGMFTAGERPTGSRDPLGLRRQAQGAVKILADLPELTGLDARLRDGAAARRARRSRSAASGDAAAPLLYVHVGSAWRTCSSSAATTSATSGPCSTAASSARARSRRASSSKRWRR